MADKDDPRQPSRADAVRGAAVQAFQATAGQAGVTRERAQELADELASAAGKLIGAFDELRPATADEVRALRTAVLDLKARVEALESALKGPSASAPSRSARAKAPAAKRSAAAKKPAAAKPGTRQSAATRSAAAKKPPSSS
jgi:polyhydroxyalkanoate synthesis regulator phasin